MLGQLNRQIGRGWSMYRNYGFAVLCSRLIGKARHIAGMPTAGQQAYRDFKAQEDAAIDQRLGADTGGIQQLPDLTIIGPNAHHGTSHIASPPHTFADSLAAAEPALGDIAQASFMDLGSGKGRTLLMAAERGYGRIVGVEFAAELDAVARANVAGRPDRDRFEIFHGDAVEAELPDGPVLLYLANPFAAKLMAVVAQNAMDNWRRNKRPVRVVYVFPDNAAEWPRAGWQPVASGPEWIVYAPE